MPQNLGWRVADNSARASKMSSVHVEDNMHNIERVIDFAMAAAYPLPEESRLVGHKIAVLPELIDAGVPTDGFGLIVGGTRSDDEVQYCVCFFAKAPEHAKREDFVLNARVRESKIVDCGLWVTCGLFSTGHSVGPARVVSANIVARDVMPYTMPFLKANHEFAMYSFPYDESLLPIFAALLCEHYTSLMRCDCDTMECASDDPSACDTARRHTMLPSSIVPELGSWQPSTHVLDRLRAQTDVNQSIN